ncbi:hypothetical protein C8R45DRAFT_993252 [Mycena sanguinolenta]|nr:hypothetical protein C8R45DRAFT_993252 [Mycena sanguinolenta]
MPSFTFSCSRTISYCVSNRRYSVQAGKETGPTRHRRAPMLSTLNPLLLLPSDYLDLSGKTRSAVSFPTKRIGSRAILPYQWRNPRRLPFPPRSAGFLYYHRDRNAAPLEGSISFRVTSKSEPASFDAGHDLLLPSGLPWRIILPQIACHTELTALRAQLLQEKLVTETQLSQCLAMLGQGYIYPELTLFRLNQEFPIRFSGGLKLATVGDAIHRFQLNAPLFTWMENGYPWAGSGLACFEPSTDPRHSGRRVIRMRITKIVDPVSSIVNQGTLLKPEAGKLLTRLNPHSRKFEPWKYDLDAKNNATAAGLRALWDNSRIS